MDICTETGTDAEAEYAEMDKGEFEANLGRHHTIRDPSTLRLPPLLERRTTLSKVLKELSLRKEETSGHHLNCLAFSILLGTDRITPEEQWTGGTRGDEERRLTHETIIRRLPPEAATKVGHNGEWWAGETRDSLNSTMETSQVMGEAHVHGFCNRINRSIVVVDVREPAAVMSEYRPGYDIQRQISMQEAYGLRNHGEPPVWILLEPDHFSALLPVRRPVAPDRRASTVAGALATADAKETAEADNTSARAREPEQQLLPTALDNPRVGAAGVGAGRATQTGEADGVAPANQRDTRVTLDIPGVHDDPTNTPPHATTRARRPQPTRPSKELEPPPGPQPGAHPQGDTAAPGITWAARVLQESGYTNRGGAAIADVDTYALARYVNETTAGEKEFRDARFDEAHVREYIREGGGTTTNTTPTPYGRPWRTTTGSGEATATRAASLPTSGSRARSSGHEIRYACNAQGHPHSARGTERRRGEQAPRARSFAARPEATGRSNLQTERARTTSRDTTYTFFRSATTRRGTWSSPRATQQQGAQGCTARAHCSCSGGSRTPPDAQARYGERSAATLPSWTYTRTT